jgi:2-iminoacetate synthase
MELCKSKQILNCCHPNALMTLKEYLMDYAGPETARAGETLIEKELEAIPKERIRELVRKNLVNIRNGQRDFRL